MFTLVSVITAAAAALVALIYVINRPSPPPPKIADLPKEMLPREVMDNSEFFGWYNSWRKVDGYLRPQEFSLEHEGSFSWEAFSEVQADTFDEMPLANRYAWSPDREFYADFLDGYDGEIVTVWLGSSEGRGEVFSRRKPGYYHDAFWLGGDRLVLLGSRPETRADGSPFCVEQEGQEKCYDRLTLDIVDVAVGGVRSYVSEKHGFGSDPYELAIRQRWSDSLTDVEKAQAGVAEDEDIEYMDTEGVIESVSAGGLIEIRTNQGPLKAVFADRVQILSDKGEAAGFSHLIPGLSVKVVAVQPEDESWTVIQRLTVMGPLGIVLYGPAAGDEVPELRVYGAAPRDVSELVVRARNRRTGRRFFDETIRLSSDGSPWQEFSLDVDLEENARANDGISVAVYDAEDQENGHVINVVYAP